jgi:hypothetical protein
MLEAMSTVVAGDERDGLDQGLKDGKFWRVVSGAISGA